MEERYPSPGLMDLAAILHQMLRAQDRGAEGREGRDRREGGREGREGRGGGGNRAKEGRNGRGGGWEETAGGWGMESLIIKRPFCD